MRDKIKRIPAHTNNPGFSERIAGYFLYGPSPGVLTPYYSASERTGLKSNPVVNLGGLPYRYPSNYNRFIRKFEKVVASKTNRSTSYSVPGNNSTGLILSTNFASYWTNTSVVLDWNTRNESIVKALNKIASRKASVGVTMGESKKAVEMIARSAIPLLKAYKAAKRGNWREVENIFHLNGSKKVSLDARYPANKWLEYQYGWKPLMQTLFEQYGLITERLRNDALLLYGDGSGFREATVDDQLYNQNHRIYYARKSTAAQICTTKLVARYTSLGMRKAGQLGLLNPLEVAWELFPFSFIVDWFMPVGNVLEALTARAGLEFVSGTSTFITGGSVTLNATHTTGNVLFEKGAIDLRVFSLNREVIYGWPMPTFYFDESPFSTTRSLNALALWRSVTGGGVPHHLRA